MNFTSKSLINALTFGDEAPWHMIYVLQRLYEFTSADLPDRWEKVGEYDNHDAAIDSLPAFKEQDKRGGWHHKYRVIRLTVQIEVAYQEQ